MEIRDLIKADQKLEDLNNKDLYHLCQEYGRGIKALRRIFSVLLVEVFRRNLHRKYGFESIHEFGAKIGGMNKELVDRILWLEKVLRDKPFLWKSFRSSGWSKIRIVANLATRETDKFWAEKVELLSKPALEVYVKWYRETYGKEGHLSPNRNLTTDQLSSPDNVPKNEARNSLLGLMEPETHLVQNLGDVITDQEILEMNKCQSVGESVIGPEKIPEYIPMIDLWKTKMFKIRFNISGETEFKFLLFKQRLSKKRKMVVTSGETFQEMLKIVEKEIAANKEWRRFLHL
jgi:hypothetical protein